MCFVCSKEPSHRDGSFEYPQHMFWLRNKKINFSYPLLSGGLKSLINIGDRCCGVGAIVAQGIKYHILHNKHTFVQMK